LLGLDRPWNEKGWYVDASGNPAGPVPYFPGANASNNTGDFGLNQGVYTTMSYSDGWSGESAKGIDFGYQMGPSAFDIAAVQQLYCPNRTSHSGNGTYGLPSANASGTGWRTIDRIIGGLGHDLMTGFPANRLARHHRHSSGERVLEQRRVTNFSRRI
jgi:hypothetical protein